MEYSNATWRLDCPNSDKLGSEIMCAMQGSSGETESVSYEGEGTDQNLSLNTFKWFVRFLAVAWVAVICYQMWEDEVSRLYLLHMITKSLQTMARIFGTWALATEMAYNNVAESLH